MEHICAVSGETAAKEDHNIVVDNLSNNQGENMLVVGKEFESLDSLRKCVQVYEETNHVQTVVFRSRTVDGLQKKAPKRKFKKDLLYGEIDYACVHSGIHKSKSNGARPNQHRYRNDCKFGFKVRITSNGEKLFIKSANLSHNHEVSHVLFSSYPKQRKNIGEPMIADAQKVLAMKGNKKLLQSSIAKSTGKNILLKDLHNLAAKEPGRRKNTMDELIKEMKSVANATVRILTNEFNTLSGIFFQDGRMKDVYASYPELLFIDATHKLNDLRMPVCLLACVDGNGLSEIVGTWIVLNDDEKTIDKMAKLFKDHNPQSANLKVIMADKDMTERKTMTKNFPNAVIQICLFHTLQTFKREVTSKKMGITESEELAIRNIINKMVYARSEEQYQALYIELKSLKKQKVAEYFENNWHHIRNEWVEGLKCQKTNFNNRTNNRIESLNQKIKSVIMKYSGIVQFFRDLMACFHSFSIDRNNKASQVIMKNNVKVFPPNSAEHCYQKYLTPYAFQFVLTQLNFMEKVKIAEFIDDDAARIATSNGIIISEFGKCSCSFFMSMGLPCRHIFKVRAQKSKHLFDDSLCSSRWTRNYFMKSHFKINQPTSNLNQSDSITVTTLSTKSNSKPLRSNKKFRKVVSIAQGIANIACELGTERFGQILKAFEDMEALIKMDKPFGVIEVPQDDQTALNEKPVEKFDSPVCDPNSTNGKTIVPDFEMKSQLNNVNVNEKPVENFDSPVCDSNPTNGKTFVPDFEIEQQHDFEASRANSETDFLDKVDAAFESLKVNSANFFKTVELETVQDGLQNHPVEVKLGEIDSSDDEEAQEEERLEKEKAMYQSMFQRIQALSAAQLHDLLLKVTPIFEEALPKSYRSRSYYADEAPSKRRCLRELFSDGGFSETQMDIITKWLRGLSYINDRSIDYEFSVLTLEIVSCLVQDIFNCSREFAEKYMDEIFAFQVKVKKIKLPSKAPRVGRPKGTANSVIGLPKKNKRTNKSNKPVAFLQLSDPVKAKKLLTWLLGDVLSKEVLENGRIIQKTDFSWPISCQFGAKAISLDLIKQYFSRAAYQSLVKFSKAFLKPEFPWLCKICETDLSSMESVGCDCCLYWFHLRCLKRTKTPASAVFFCKFCCSEAKTGAAVLLSEHIVKTSILED